MTKTPIQELIKEFEGLQKAKCYLIPENAIMDFIYLATAKLEKEEQQIISLKKKCEADELNEHIE